MKKHHVFIFSRFSYNESFGFNEASIQLIVLLILPQFLSFFLFSLNVVTLGLANSQNLKADPLLACTADGWMRRREACSIQRVTIPAGQARLFSVRALRPLALLLRPALDCAQCLPLCVLHPASRDRSEPSAFSCRVATAPRMQRPTAGRAPRAPLVCARRDSSSPATVGGRMCGFVHHT